MSLLLDKQLLMGALKMARDLVCKHFCTRVTVGPGPNDAHCYDCNTILRLMENYR